MSELSKEARSTELRKSNVDQNPFKQFARWYEEALGSDLILPNAMALATSSRDGVPSARMVLLKDFDENGFVFYTNYESPKARDLDENPKAALLFYWAPLDKQVRITGSVERVSPEESEAYFRTRPVESQLGAWASNQSSTIESREVLENRLSQLIEEYRDTEVPLPPYWGGYRLVPDTFEFWLSRPGRLHDRLRFSRRDGEWTIERLAP
ncbi:MAG TPA: pyridoxamine 5'-phosphate oxidase [Blastocatellia bacterium]|jgi:pyridoxamine 5'-phosphate oxidase|nr:pyridoxamine 5'-phosphate oxidase [Blastocatellia bacterium]